MRLEPQDAKVGYWWARCCPLDLYRIDDQETIDDFLEEVENDEWWAKGIWETLEEAQAFFRETDPGMVSEAILATRKGILQSGAWEESAMP